MEENKIVLLVDELNAISTDKPGHQHMSFFLNNLVALRGSALVHSTHLRDASDPLRGRNTANQLNPWLSTHEHKWLAIP